MNLINKISIVIFIILSCSLIIPLNTSNASSDLVDKVNEMNNGTLSDVDSEKSKIKEIAKKVLGAIRLITGLVSIIIIAYAGFKILVEDTPEGKNNVKKTMVPIVTGIFITFSATSIATFIIKIFEKQ